MEENQKQENSSDTFKYSVPQVDQGVGSEISSEPTDNNITWSSLEFEAHKKKPTWFIIFFLILILVGVGVYYIVHSVFAVVMVSLVGVAFGVIAARKPRTLQYQLNSNGVQVGSRSNNYGEFKSFSVIEGSNLGSVSFNPFKRFNFPLTIYFERTDQDKIINFLSNYLPYEQASNDPVDQLMRKLHF